MGQRGRLPTHVGDPDEALDHDDVAGLCKVVGLGLAHAVLLLARALQPRDRARIALLVIACIVPALLLVAFVTYLSYERERANIGQHTLATTRELMRVVERELGADESAMQSLALSGAIANGRATSIQSTYASTTRRTHVDG